ncbi:MAG: hypothetical protein LBB98_04050 [Treponema sp.]|jgi:hypothetical protein|nr:hypothetical protein [Treponema sp.]
MSTGWMPGTKEGQLSLTKDWKAVMTTDVMAWSNLPDPFTALRKKVSQRICKVPCVAVNTSSIAAGNSPVPVNKTRGKEGMYKMRSKVWTNILMITVLSLSILLAGCEDKIILSDAKAITSFVIGPAAGEIGEQTINVTVPYGTDITNLSPVEVVCFHV